MRLSHTIIAVLLAAAATTSASAGGRQNGGGQGPGSGGRFPARHPGAIVTAPISGPPVTAPGRPGRTPGNGNGPSIPTPVPRPGPVLVPRVPPIRPQPVPGWRPDAQPCPAPSVPCQDPIVVPGATPTLPVSSPLPAEEPAAIPQLEVGREFLLPGTGLGANAGRVTVTFGTVLVDCPVSAWSDRGLQATVGAVVLARATQGELLVVGADGRTVVIIPVEVLPAAGG